MKKKIVLMLIALFVMSLPLAAEARTTYRYATKKMTIREKASVKSKKLTTVKTNTKMTLIKSGKKWTKVKRGKAIGYVKTAAINKKRSQKKYTGGYFRRAGVIRWGGRKYTWYSQRAMPGRGLKIPGRHVDAQGFVCDKDGYIVVGSSVANKNKRVITPTPFGKYGKCYDCGYVGSNHYDVYVAW